MERTWESEEPGIDDEKFGVECDPSECKYNTLPEKP